MTFLKKKPFLKSVNKYVIFWERGSAIYEGDCGSVNQSVEHEITFHFPFFFLISHALLVTNIYIIIINILVKLVKFWKSAFRRCEPSYSTTGSLGRGIWASKVSSYCLRGLLWAGGVTASNKVIEALACRFSNSKQKQITLEGYLLALVRIHLAQGRKDVEALKLEII